MILGGVAMVPPMILWPAGRWDWPLGWAFIGWLLLIGLSLDLFVYRSNPGLAERRTHVGEGTPRWDRMLLVGIRLSSFAGMVLCAADQRWGLAPLSPWWALPGTVLAATGQALIIWSMRSNAHFEATVRIQEQQTVVDGGPYAWIRHPGYAGFLLVMGVIPLQLGSLLGAPFAILTCGLLCVRTAREDAFLRARLAGYAGYSSRVRSRLIPGFW